MNAFLLEYGWLLGFIATMATSAFIICSLFVTVCHKDNRRDLEARRVAIRNSFMDRR